MFLFFLQGMNTLGTATSGIGVATPFQGSSFFINPASLALEKKALSVSFDMNSDRYKLFALTDTSPDLFKGGLILGFHEKQDWDLGGLISFIIKESAVGVKALFCKEGIVSFQAGFLSTLSSKITLGGKFHLGPKWNFINFQGGLTLNWDRKFFLGIDGLYDGEKVFRIGSHLLYLLQNSLGLLGGIKSSFEGDINASLGLQLNYGFVTVLGAYQRDFTLKKDIFSFQLGFSWVK